MALFTAVLGWPYLLATVLAVEAAMLHNFRWHERWTWRDRTAAESGVRLRLLRFHLTIGATSAVGNLLLTAVSVEGLGLHPVPANVAAVACLGAAEFPGRRSLGVRPGEPASGQRRHANAGRFEALPYGACEVGSAGGVAVQAEGVDSHVNRRPVCG